MRKISLNYREPLHDVRSTRRLEQIAASALSPHALMARAGEALANLTEALAPHAQTLWVACGPGNNGGDGLVAATLLHNRVQERGLNRRICLTLAGDPDKLPPDAGNALRNALASGLTPASHPPSNHDFAIDALLGIGATREPEGNLARLLSQLRSSHSPVLAVDVPSGLMADTGVLLGEAATPTAARHTLSLLTLKPGLFTGHGRDAAGDIWFDDLGVGPGTPVPHTALLYAPMPDKAHLARRHASHKGSYGDVLVIGGQGLSINGVAMCGAALLAA
ncbi:MAG TPA: NAD(P)H-hydrate epimerase, partial [Hydrogenophaga sp.]